MGEKERERERISNAFLCDDIDDSEARGTPKEAQEADFRHVQALSSHCHSQYLNEVIS